MAMANLRVTAHGVDEGGIQDKDYDLGVFERVIYGHRLGVNGIFGIRDDGSVVMLAYCHRSSLIGGYADVLSGSESAHFSIETEE